MWIANELEVFTDYVTYVLARTQAGTELTHIMIARSRKQLEHSRAILSIEPPKIWHPKPK